MQILFIHHAFPGQFKFIAPLLAVKGHEVVALTHEKPVYPTPKIKIIQFNKASPHKGLDLWAQVMLDKFWCGQQVLETSEKLKDDGFLPQVVYCHPDWGESLFLREAFPDAKILTYVEHYYSDINYDSLFDKEFVDSSLEIHSKAKSFNALRLMSLEYCDKGICPTEFQKQNQPIAYQDKIIQVHDGIQTNQLVRNDSASITIKNKGITLSRQDEVITFANRGLEPRRGFHVFMRAIPEIQRQRPNAEIVILGKDVIVYGNYKKLPNDNSFKQHMLEELAGKINLDKVHFVDWVDYQTYKNIIQVSKVHVYLTMPFVLSWSLLEIMSVQGCVIGSNTEPVREVIEDEVHGLLVEFSDTQDIADKITRVLNDDVLRERLGLNARKLVINNYDLNSICLPKQVDIIESMGLQ